ncbi:MAG: hypothetical protein OM95_03500 [Bdellovibrio sp. ArHS]|nr:MAG: hypothetical protein OM95_03500 [Bdellovibrio sp. ArHS]
MGISAVEKAPSTPSVEPAPEDEKITATLPPFQINENTDSTIVLILNHPVPVETLVSWEIQEPSAVDFFQKTSGSFTIAKNGSSGTFNLKPINDLVFKGDHIFSIKLSSSLPQLTFEGSGSGKSFPFDLLEDEVKPKVSFSVASQSVSEGYSTGSVRISMSGVLADALAISFSVGGTSTSLTDHDLSSGSVQIPAGSTYVDLPFTIHDDVDIEGTESLVITLQNVGSSLASLEGELVHTVVITDNDFPEPLLLFPAQITLAPGEQTTFTATGASPPYVFSLIGDPAAGTMDPATGVFVAGTYSGEVQIRVTDVGGSTQESTLTVFSPTQWGTLKLWLNAGTLSLTDETAVQTWSDFSGTGNHATNGTVATRPVFKTGVLNGRSVVRFNGSTQFLETATSPVSGAAARTTVTVIANGDISLGDRQVIAGYGNTSSFLNYYGLAFANKAEHTNRGAGMGSYYHSSSDASYTYPSLNSNGSMSSSIFGSSEAMILVQQYDGTTDRLYLNGKLLEEKGVTLTTAASTKIQIGRLRAADGYFKGDIAEVLAFSDVLNLTQQKQLECYLANKYKITLDASATCHSGPLKLSAVPGVNRGKVVNTSGQYSFKAAGGSPPYQYSLVSGGGSVNAGTGVYTASSSAGTATIQVTDSLGGVATQSISVVPHALPMAWFKADSLLDSLANDSKVTRWENMLGEGFDFSQILSKAPTLKTNILNGQPVVRFTGTEWMGSAVMPPLQNNPRSIIAVIANGNSSIAKTQHIVGYGTSYQNTKLYSLCFRTTDQSFITMNYQNSSSISAAASSDSPLLISSIYNGTSQALYINGVLSVTNSPAVDTANAAIAHGLNIGKDFFGDIAEIMVFNRDLTSEERQEIESLLKAKYGLP